MLNEPTDVRPLADVAKIMQDWEAFKSRYHEHCFDEARTQAAARLDCPVLELPPFSKEERAAITRRAELNIRVLESLGMSDASPQEVLAAFLPEFAPPGVSVAESGGHALALHELQQGLKHVSEHMGMESPHKELSYALQRHVLDKIMHKWVEARGEAWARFTQRQRETLRHELYFMSLDGDAQTEYRKQHPEVKGWTPEICARWSELLSEESQRSSPRSYNMNGYGGENPDNKQIAMPCIGDFNRFSKTPAAQLLITATQGLCSLYQLDLFGHMRRRFKTSKDMVSDEDITSSIAQVFMGAMRTFMLNRRVNGLTDNTFSTHLGHTNKKVMNELWGIVNSTVSRYSNRESMERRGAFRRQICSADVPGLDGHSLAGQIIDEMAEDPSEGADRRIRDDKLMAAMESLPWKHRLVLTLCFGLDAPDPATMPTEGESEEETKLLLAKRAEVADIRAHVMRIREAISEQRKLARSEITDPNQRWQREQSDNVTPPTFEEIGGLFPKQGANHAMLMVDGMPVLGVSKQRIDQIKKEALRALANGMCDHTAWAEFLRNTAAPAAAISQR